MDKEFLAWKKESLSQLTSGMFRLYYDPFNNHFKAGAFIACGRGFKDVWFDDADCNILFAKVFEFCSKHIITYKNGRRCYKVKKL